MLKLFVSYSFLFLQQNATIEKFEVNAEVKTLEKNKMIVKKSTIACLANGNCITHFITPSNFYLIANILGEVKIYDPSKNTAIIQQDEDFSSKTNSFYYFLFGNTTDMGLSELGFIPQETIKKDKDFIVIWKLKKPNNKLLVQQVKLVHRNNNPIFMEYLGAKNLPIRKVYYYNYTTLYNKSFPTTTTDIAFNIQNKDSTISKTTYSGFKINEQASNDLFSFKIPISAKRLN